MFLKEIEPLMVLFLTISIISSHYVQQVEGMRTVIIISNEKWGMDNT